MKGMLYRVSPHIMFPHFIPLLSLSCILYINPDLINMSVHEVAYILDKLNKLYTCHACRFPRAIFFCLKLIVILAVSSDCCCSRVTQNSFHKFSNQGSLIIIKSLQNFSVKIKFTWCIKQKQLGSTQQYCIGYEQQVFLSTIQREHRVTVHCFSGYSSSQ